MSCFEVSAIAPAGEDSVTSPVRSPVATASSLPRSTTSSRTDCGSTGAGGAGRNGSAAGTGVGMKRSFSPIFQEKSFGTTVEVAGMAVESVRAASSQSSPVSWLTSPAKETCTLPVSGTSCRS